MQNFLNIRLWKHMANLVESDNFQLMVFMGISGSSGRAWKKWQIFPGLEKFSNTARHLRRRAGNKKNDVRIFRIFWQFRIVWIVWIVRQFWHLNPKNWVSFSIMRWKLLPRARNVEISMVAGVSKMRQTQLEKTSSQKWEKGIRLVFQFKIFRLFNQFPHTGRTYVRRPAKFSESSDNCSCKIHAK